MKKVTVIAVVFVIAVALILLSFGFRVCTSVALLDFAVSEDGRQLQFRVGVPTSMGYIRAYHDAPGNDPNAISSTLLIRKLYV